MNLRFGKYNSESCRTYRYSTKLRSPLALFAIHLRFHYEPRHTDHESWGVSSRGRKHKKIASFKGDRFAGSLGFKL